MAGADLTGFLAAAGGSLADAQGTLTGDLADVPSAVAISEAELEVKATLESGAGGAIALQPVSSEDLSTGKIDSAALSTVRIRYVAVTDAAPVSSPTPKRSADDVIGTVKAREDIAALDNILGGLRFEAQFVPVSRNWLVTATDPDGRPVRNVVLPDTGR